MIDWDRPDIEGIIKGYLSSRLEIEVKGGEFTDPNSREIRIMLEGECICRDWFDVVQKGEYEG